MRQTIENHLKENGKSYLVLFLVLILGLIIGIISINRMPIEQKKDISNYLNDFTNQIKENNSINYGHILKSSITHKVKFTIVLILLSFSIWGEIGTFLLVGYKGYSLGYSISSAISIFGIAKGLTFALPLVFLSELVYIPAIFYISVLSIKNYKTLIKEDYDNKKLMAIKYMVSLLATACVVLTSSLLQTYLNTNLFLMLTKYF